MFEKKRFKVVTSINVNGQEATEIAKFETEEEAIRKVTKDAVTFKSMFVEETENEAAMEVEDLLNCREVRIKRVSGDNGFYAVIFTRLVK